MIDLSNLRLITEGNKSLLDSLLLEFVRTTDADLAGLHQAVEHKDTESVAQLAHRIKGAASIIGANKLVELTEQLENAGKQQDLKQLSPLLKEADHCYKSVSEEISRYR